MVTSLFMLLYQTEGKDSELNAIRYNRKEHINDSTLDRKLNRLWAEKGQCGDVLGSLYRRG